MKKGTFFAKYVTESVPFFILSHRIEKQEKGILFRAYRFGAKKQKKGYLFSAYCAQAESRQKGTFLSVRAS